MLFPPDHRESKVGSPSGCDSCHIGKARGKLNTKHPRTPSWLKSRVAGLALWETAWWNLTCDAFLRLNQVPLWRPESSGQAARCSIFSFSDQNSQLKHLENPVPTSVAAKLQALICTVLMVFIAKKTIDNFLSISYGDPKIIDNYHAIWPRPLL